MTNNLVIFFIFSSSFLIRDRPKDVKLWQIVALCDHTLPYMYGRIGGIMWWFDGDFVDMIAICGI